MSLQSQKFLCIHLVSFRMPGHIYIKTLDGSWNCKAKVSGTYTASSPTYVYHKDKFMNSFQQAGPEITTPGREWKGALNTYTMWIHLATSTSSLDITDSTAGI